MALFGYVCSPLCRGKAEDKGIDVPVYAGQKQVADLHVWKKTVLIAGSVAGVIAVIAGAWFWYAWFGSAPSPIFSVRFEDRAYSGTSAFAGKDKDQIVFLHGFTLARYDVKKKKQIWSRDLMDKAKIDDEIAKIQAETQKEIDRANSENPEFVPRMPNPVKLRKELELGEAAALELRVAGQNVWVRSGDKLTKYDWANGTPGQQLPIQSRYGRVLRKGDELLLVDDERGKRTITHIDLNTSDIRTEQILGESQPEVAAAEKDPANKAGGPPTLASLKGSGTSGLPLKPGQDTGKPMDPKKVSQQAQHLSYPAKVALPAVLANSRSQERTMRELEDTSGGTRRNTNTNAPDENVAMIPTKDGFIQMTVKLLEHKEVARTAMKAPSAKKVMDGNLRASQSLEAANEMLNDMQRDRGGDVVMEDQSRNLVKIRHPGTSDDYVGEVIGNPEIFPLQSVTIIAASKSILVLDKKNKKMWQASLTYDVPSRYGDPEEDDPRYGQGPCVEKGNLLYVFDQGVLTSFDLQSGNVKWRVLSVGIEGLYFDDKGDLYLNTTDAGPDSIKYSRQIDVSTHASSVVMKVDAKTGKTLWTARPGTGISYISGKYIYTSQGFTASPEEDEDDGSGPSLLGGTQQHLRIKRLDQKTGKVLWEHYEPRGPLDVQFDKNVIRVVFKKEVEILRFLSL
jgi:hypothetical protein